MPLKFVYQMRITRFSLFIQRNESILQNLNFIYISSIENIYNYKIEHILLQKMSRNRQNIEKIERDHKYDVISYQKRKNLIELVIEHNISIYQASELLKIKNATAKAIIRKYRHNGHIFKKKNEEPSKIHLNSQNLINNSIDRKSKVTKPKEIISEVKQQPKEDDLRPQNLKITLLMLYWFPYYGLNPNDII